MTQHAEKARRYAVLAGAHGWCTDEGDEHRPAVFEYNRLDALTVARWGDYGEYAQHCANSKDLKKQIRVADYIANADAARAAGVVVIPDVTERQLGKAEFFARRAAGVEQLMRHGGFAARRSAELEWNMREAEVETGFTRDDPNPIRREKVRKKYRALCNRDRKS
ncbi:hypothetical protein MQC88_08280 [Luteimonas sp. 50]|uniref:Uncharacterized protein n=1 Tax=Cognatiluteimonas sedimenti TaxID=2927791 RepID=A0ABT0A4Q3_9GAMM|nr:hypothetical protein [Lysobacter sedimenti]MCJ0825951.1 hypothetical protein [Lysobacter sedimenti]